MNHSLPPFISSWQLSLLIELIRGPWKSCTIKSHQQHFFFKKVRTFNHKFVRHFSSIFLNSWRLSLPIDYPSRRVNFHLLQPNHVPEESFLQVFIGSECLGMDLPVWCTFINLKELFKTYLPTQLWLLKHTSHRAKTRRNATIFNHLCSQWMQTTDSVMHLLWGIAYSSPKILYTENTNPRTILF